MNRCLVRVHTLAALAVFTTILLAGCSENYGVMQTYPGPRQPRDQVARVGGTFIFAGIAGKTVLLKTIDGRPVTEGDLDVLPGEHTISVAYEAEGGMFSQTSVSQCFITFQAQTGHSYLANGESLPRGKWRCWIDDIETKQRVAGTCRQNGSEDVPTKCSLSPVPVPQSGPPR